MAFTYDTDDKFMVIMSADTLQTIYNQMEDDDPEAEDDEPFTPDLMDEALHTAEVIDISTPSTSPSGISEYLVIIPRQRRRAHSFAAKRLTSSPTLSESRRSRTLSESRRSRRDSN
ncbi:unnamed protein product [Acanthocheilonema viteae]|uniref:Uncharacterized protein n=1 Tax=Acanthocheilonema viteae TaxID=6277 RepID=A0A498SCI1_ACAVI|nr:unnamed protein product [Acanthocheilonema viteae]